MSENSDENYATNKTTNYTNGYEKITTITAVTINSIENTKI